MALRLAKVPGVGLRTLSGRAVDFSLQAMVHSRFKKRALSSLTYLSYRYKRAKGRSCIDPLYQFVWITACYCPDVSSQLFQWILFSGRFIRGTSFFKPLCSRPLLSNKISPVFFLGGREGLYTGYPLFRHLNCSKVAFLKEWFLRRISFFIGLSRNKHFQLFFSSRDIAHPPT